MSPYEKLRAMFASVQNWLALMLMLVNVLHCRMRHVTSGCTTAAWLSVRVGCYFSCRHKRLTHRHCYPKHASACLAARNQVRGFYYSFKRIHHEIFHTFCIAYNRVRIDCLR